MRGSTPVWLGVLALLAMVGCGPKPTPKRPSAVETHIQAAEAHEKRRRYDLAESEYRAAIAAAASASERARSRRALADALLFWGKYPEAEVVLAALVKDQPGEVSAWHDLGMVRAKLGRSEGAETALRESVKRGPGDPRSRIALAALLVNGKRYREAQEQYRALLKLEIPPKIRKAVQKALVLLDRQIELDAGGAGR